MNEQYQYVYSHAYALYSVSGCQYSQAWLYILATSNTNMYKHSTLLSSVVSPYKVSASVRGTFNKPYEHYERLRKHTNILKQLCEDFVQLKVSLYPLITLQMSCGCVPITLDKSLSIGRSSVHFCILTP
jgi:hypothetical protein